MTSAVVIPTRDRAHLIGRAVQSALAQTLPVDEVVVVDDGSSDGTAAVVSALAERDARVRLVRLDRSIGAAAARNHGVATTTADWILFLDSDDIWSEGKHEAQRAALSASPSAIACFTGLTLVVGPVRMERPIAPRATAKDLHGGNVFGSTSSAMVRREAFLAVGGFDPQLPSCQDWDLWLKLSDAGGFAVAPAPLVDVVQDSNGRISNNHRAVFAGHKIVFARALARVKNPFRRVRVSALHRARIAQILLYDLDRPVAAIGGAMASLVLCPTARAALVLYRASRRVVARLKRPKGRAGLQTVPLAGERAGTGS